VNLRWLALITLLWTSAVWADWPEIPSPPNSRIESIGDQVRLNGIPMRMQRVLTTGNTADIIRFYRKALGPKHVEENLPDGRLLAQGRGDHFLTVRIKALGPSLTESLVSISDARAAQNAAGRPLGFQLPSRTQLVSDMESTDDGKVSRQLVFLNDHSVDANVDFITETLQGRGYKPQPDGVRNSASERVLMFGGAQREARLVVVRKDGTSNVVLTTVLMP
jgi:hypothetical protein